MSINAQHTINWVEQGYVPDNLVRKGIKRLLKTRLDEIFANDREQAETLKHEFIASMKLSAIAIAPEMANQQHYELPVRFYELVLGEHNKYSCSYWTEQTKTLDKAEQNALEISCQHAQIDNGQHILELGCGWGALTIWMAQHYPDSQITAVSNSSSQKQYIEDLADTLRINNVQVITCDMNDFDTDETFDRVVSIEMFEHMRNWQLLLNKIAGWLNHDGKFFMHVFSHCHAPYAFEVKHSSDWMSEHFFTGGMMPSDDLPLYFQNDLKISTSWTWNGGHYAKTSNAWLSKMDANKQLLMPLLLTTYGQDQVNTWWHRWRLFFMACAELFAYDNGQQWHVRHYLFEKG
ncbi:MAG: cyclopropane-fatty-acyl-phospholipid synthase family protein [Gammaproteobacteria bacterium]|nr:cyclopropane-fatty-acyl-phospholipid synthase family protein [Gammaproteobacteria bacterium]